MQGKAPARISPRRLSTKQSAGPQPPPPREPVQILCEDPGGTRGVGMARKRYTAEEIVGTLRDTGVAGDACAPSGF